MDTKPTDLKTAGHDSLAPVHWAALLGVAAAVAVLHLLTNGRYGFHRDELQTLYDARHLNWGFIAYPPFTPFVEHIGVALFGLSLVGLRLFSVLAQTAGIVVTGLMAHELGGKRLAQFTASLAVALSPLPLFEGTEFQYTTFDYLWWVLIAYLTIRLLRSDDPRWWLAIGAAVGVGLLTKYSIVFFVAGVLAGAAFTRARRFFKSPWFWAGIALALAIFLPNFLWQARHDFISYRFLQYIHARDVQLGRDDGFLINQFFICINLFATPLAIAGLVSFLRSSRYRMLAWMYLVPLALLFIGNGRDYYLAAAYPMLLAMGAVAGERWAAASARLSPSAQKKLRKGHAPKSRRGASGLGRRVAVGVFFTGLAACGAAACAIILPLQSTGPLRDFALAKNNNLQEEFGWNDLIKTVAGVRDSLTPAQQASLGVMVGNYGELGAVEILGPQYHLPPPISLVNSAWLRGYPTPPPTTLIVVGLSRQAVDQVFTSCQLAGHNANSEGVSNEESLSHPDIFVCGPPILPWPDFWKQYQGFG
jgi:hypothetical protein